MNQSNKSKRKASWSNTNTDSKSSRVPLKMPRSWPSWKSGSLRAHRYSVFMAKQNGNCRDTACNDEAEIQVLIFFFYMAINNNKPLRASKLQKTTTVLLLYKTQYSFSRQRRWDKMSLCLHNGLQLTSPDNFKRHYS